MDDELQTIVIDSGYGMIKAGFSGDDFPRYIFPTVVGTNLT
jgi:actin